MTGYNWKVLISAPYMLPIIERFSDFFEEHRIEYEKANVEERLEESELLDLIGDFDGIICGDDRITKKVIENAPKLKVISKWGTGVDSIDTKTASERGIPIYRTIDAFTEPVCDSTLGYILNFARRLPWMDRQMKAGHWEKIPGQALNECTIGVIGLGAIGSGTLRRARSFGAELLATDVREINAGHLASVGATLVGLNTLLERADYVCLHCDLNESSYHLIGTDQLARMKPTAVLLNLARGQVVCETALIAALERGVIAGAALDVFEFEPLPKDSPLLGMSNVMVAPHNSNSSSKAWERVHRSSLNQLLNGLQAGSDLYR